MSNYEEDYYDLLKKHDREKTIYILILSFMMFTRSIIFSYFVTVYDKGNTVITSAEHSTANYNEMGEISNESN